MAGEPPSPTRRSLLAGAAAAAWGVGAACSWSPASGRRGQARPRVGFLRQTDAAPLLMADELGTYAKHGLAPVLLRGESPMELQDRLLAGDLAAAQLPASIPILRALASADPAELVTLMVMSHNGGAVTLGREMCASVKFLELAALRQNILRRPATSPAVFAVPALGGTDDLMLRYLLAAAGVPSDRIQVSAAPAEQMLADLREDRIVGFSAPDPWSALAAVQDIGFTFATAQDIYRRAPRSVLATTAKVLDQRRPELKSLLRAVMEASVWLDVPANRTRPILGEVLGRRQNLDLDPGPVRSRLGSVYDLGCRMGERDFEDDMLYFHAAGRVNVPLRADACLYAALLTRFGLVTAPPPRGGPTDAQTAPGKAETQAQGATQLQTIAGTISDELYRGVAREIGLPLPDDMKPFVVTLDAVRFDPAAPAAWPALWRSDALNR